MPERETWARIRQAFLGLGQPSELFSSEMGVLRKEVKGCGTELGVRIEAGRVQEAG